MKKEAYIEENHNISIDLNTYLEKSIGFTKTEELFDHFKGALNTFGYDSVVFICFPPRKGAGEVKAICPYFNVPQEIVCEYLEQKLYETGPVFEISKISGQPVVWSDVLDEKNSAKTLPKLSKFLDLLKEHGYYNGLTIPVFGVGNSFGYISLASHETEINLEDPKNIIIFHLCMNLMNQYFRISEINNPPNVKLTKREKEVLTWVLHGKSNSVIAEIMELSEHTVSTYIKRSTVKLNASSKWSAALTAVLIGIIQY